MNSSVLQLKGKIALITGASKGFGRALAKLFWCEGASLILISRNTEKLLQLENELSLMNNNQKRLLIIPYDLRNITDIENTVENAIRKMGRLDVLINNAAVLGPVGPSFENNWAEFQETLIVNLLAPINMCIAAVRHMKRNKKGKIINLSGGGATSTRPNFSAYGTSKAALVRYSEILAEEVRCFNIDVNCIAPGIMNTQIVAKILEAGPQLAGEKEYSQALKQVISNNSSIERAAELAVFLASSESDGITGKLISAVWDQWLELPKYRKELMQSDIYTLRRIIPKDRGYRWEEV